MAAKTSVAQCIKNVMVVVVVVPLCAVLAGGGAAGTVVQAGKGFRDGRGVLGFRIKSEVKTVVVERVTVVLEARNGRQMLRVYSRETSESCERRYGNGNKRSQKGSGHQSIVRRGEEKKK